MSPGGGGTAPGGAAPGPAAALLSRADALLRALARCRERAPDAVHDVRVAARRMEAALWVWRNALSPGEASALRRAPRRWRRRLAHARDLEVLAHELGSPPLCECGETIGALARALAREGDRVTSRLRVRPRGRRVKRWRGALERATGDAPEAELAAVLAAGAARVRRRQRDALAALAAAQGVDDDGPLHAARVALKRWRYAEEAYAAASGGALSSRSDEARELQRRLGSLHDRANSSVLLLARARRASRRGRSREASELTAAAALADRLRSEGLATLPPLLRSIGAPAR
ncbi:MAG TPA: CHAD domain-containing protein [Candidatus Acidoferrales bacterium]|nr:CHAD domain-containing protein [Candidatus Acidoferrales bacterium]